MAAQSTRSGPGSSRILRQAVRWAVVVATAAVLVEVFRGRVDELDEVDLRLRPVWLAVAAPPVAAATLVLPLAWRRLVTALGGSLGWWDAVGIWVLAQTTRYLPTGLVAVASRVALAGEAGVSRPVAAASFGLEAVLLVGWSAVLGAVLVPGDVAPLSVRLAGGLGAGAVLVALPWLLRGGGALLARLPRLPRRLRLLALGGPGSGAGRVPGPRAVYEAVGLFGLNAALRTGASVAVVAAVLPVGPDDAAFVAGAVAVGVALGLVGVTPAGIGVREGVIAAVLAERYGLGDATAAAVVLRLFDVVVELVVVAAVLAARWRGVRWTRPPPAGTPPGEPR